MDSYIKRTKKNQSLLDYLDNIVLVTANTPIGLTASQYNLLYDELPPYIKLYKKYNTSMPYKGRTLFIIGENNHG